MSWCASCCVLAKQDGLVGVVAAVVEDVGGVDADEFGEVFDLVFDAAAVVDAVAVDGVGDGAVEFVFEFADELAAGLVVDAAGFAGAFGELEVFGAEFVVEDQVEYDGIDGDGAKFFHEVGGEGGVAASGGVQEADVRVESAGFDEAVDVVEE